MIRTQWQLHSTSQHPHTALCTLLVTAAQRLSSDTWSNTRSHPSALPNPCAPLPIAPLIAAAQQLSGFQRDTWYVFERVLIVRDLATGGGRTFLNFDDAKEFRELIYRQYGGLGLVWGGAAQGGPGWRPV